MEYVWIGQGGVGGVWVGWGNCSRGNADYSIVLDMVMDWGYSVASVGIRIQLDLETGHTNITPGILIKNRSSDIFGSFVDT